MKVILGKSDIFGVLASVLCLVHCIATPFLFMAYTSTITETEGSPIWWRNLDYIFLIISFFAVARSAKNSSKNLVSSLLWINWTVLFILIFNEKMKLVLLPEIVMYITAITLAFLHIYNLKYCQCKMDGCCETIN